MCTYIVTVTMNCTMGYIFTSYAFMRNGLQSTFVVLKITISAGIIKTYSTILQISFPVKVTSLVSMNSET